MPEHEAVIGLEVHLHLKTKTKMFCGCEAKYFGDEPNTHNCPVCLGLPGVLPSINGQAVDYGILMGLALGCQIASWTQFHRKNYYYSDMPKNYQISQYDLPIAEGGASRSRVSGSASSEFTSRRTRANRFTRPGPSTA